MKVHAVNAGYFKLDGGAMFGVVPKSLWQKAHPADENNMCSWAMRCLLVEHGPRRILIDCGMGDKQDEKFFAHYYLHGEDSLEKSLAALGLHPGDITDVFLTHLHFDHCGGAVKRLADGSLAPAFPQAVYWTNRAHWASATHPNAREKASFLKENILPLEEHGVLRFVEAGDGDEWLPGFRIRLVHGHTDAMMLPLLELGDNTLLYCADLLPSSHHIPLPWVMAYDMRPLDTLQEKERLLQEALSNNWILFFEHDAAVECGRLQESIKGIRLGETFALKAIS